LLLGLGHVDLVCSDVERSIAFYLQVLGPLGLGNEAVFEGERGESIHYLRFPTPGSGSIGLRQAFQDQKFELYAPGLHHIAFAVDARADVDAAHEAAIAAGADVLHAPREFPQYRADYYATFFLDPDGFRVEVATARDSRL
jgi:glyoxylase I family protein